MRTTHAISQNHRIIECFELEGTSPQAAGRDTFHKTRLLRATSSLALNAAREGAATTSLGNLFQCLPPS